MNDEITGIFDVSPEWMAEIRRRCKEIDDGVAKLIPAEQVYAEIEKELRQRFGSK
jgi:hypothetical protein